MKKIQSIRGMNDVLPEDSPVWQYFESTVSQLLQQYGYSEIRTPIVEKTELFKRSIGEVTDIVEKEMYTFNDRNDESLTMRPEGTASVVRACEQHGLLHNQIQRLWYSGPMFRYERPQKGRQREFRQVGVEVFGLAGPDIDAELLVMTARLWRELGIADAITLQLNSLGTPQSRAHYRAALVEFLQAHREQLDQDSLRRLESNPLRILDSKNPEMQQLLGEAPNLQAYLDDESRADFEQLCELLNAAGIDYEVNPRLVRGLDYYSKTVFEWVTDSLGAQGTVCAGGRYDGLVEQLGGKPTPGVGFAMGIERLVLMLDALNAVPDSIARQIDVYLVAEESIQAQALVLAEKLRDECPGLRLQLHCGGGSYKSREKKALKSGASMGLFLDQQQMSFEPPVGTLKYFSEKRPPETGPVSYLAGLVKEYFK